MREQLPGHYLGALDTKVGIGGPWKLVCVSLLMYLQSILQPDALHTSVVRLVPIYSRELGISFPSLNHPLLLFKYIKELALPCMPALLCVPFRR